MYIIIDKAFFFFLLYFWKLISIRFFSILSLFFMPTEGAITCSITSFWLCMKGSFRNEIHDWEKMRNNIPRRKNSDAIKRNMRHTVNYKRIRCRIARFLASLRLLSGVHNDTSIYVFLRWHWLRWTTRNSSFEKAPVAISINSNMWKRHLHRLFRACIACSITDHLSFFF